MTEATFRYGQFVWRELATHDVAKARGFYGELFGWKFQEMDMGTFQYPVIMLGERGIGGITPLESKDARPAWTSVVSVKDTDEAARHAKAQGGKVQVAPEDLPNVGRFAVLADADGAVFSVLQASDGGGGAQPERPELHEFCWETISGQDLARTKQFYAKVLGWKTEKGPGDGDVFITATGAQVADMQLAQNMPASWFTYVVVDKLESATDKATRLGAKVIVSRIDIPKVGSIAQIEDPQGALLGLFEPGMM